MNKTLLAVALAPLFFQSQAFATETSTDDVMVVTANRFEQPLSSVLAPISVVTREEIEAIQAKALPEVLRRLPGVEVAQNGGLGQNASVYIRGANSNQTLVLVDGVRISSSIGGGVNFNRFPIGLVERVEVIRGPGAAKYGSDAIGGVINIITRSQQGDDTKQMTLGAGSRAYKEANFVAKSDVSDTGHLQVAAGFVQTDGYNVRPQPGKNDGVKHGYDSKNALVGYEHQLSDNTKAYGSASWYENEAEYDSYGVKNFGYVRNQNVTAQLEHQAAAWQTQFSTNYQDTQSRNYSQSEGKDKASTRTNSDMFNVQWANLYQLTDMLQLGGGLDWRREKLKDDALSYGSKHKLAGESRNNYGGYVSGLMEWNQLTVEGNARYDKHDKYDNYATWSLATAYQINEQHRVRASYGTAFKAPTYSDLASKPELMPEESKNFELGASGYYDFMQWNLAAYDNKVDNLIIWYKGADGRFNSDNVDARIKGIEFDVQFATGIVNHTVVADFKDHKDAKDVQLARRAKQNYKWISDVAFGDATVSLTYLYTGKRLDLPTTAPTDDSYLPATSLWDLSTTYQVTDALVVRGRVDNLFNEKYETAKGYPAPERAFYVNGSYQF
ncbi:TonB-dependent receptor domain-containing protein [Photobacterium kagoshimensis]|uniref:TonB-dependent receptor domain-containing protein n=1 Tax=Photobacterium kagoshimensis TaxID=2910242 RepID=UPI003D1439A5